VDQIRTGSIDGTQGSAGFGETSFIRRCSTDALTAIVELWDPKLKTFWRSTSHRARDAGTDKAQFFPTVSLRCVDALLVAAVEQPEWVSPETKEILFRACIPNVVGHDSQGLDSTFNVPGEDQELNVFTLSVYVQAFARIVRAGPMIGEVTLLARERLKKAVQELVGHSTFSNPDNDKHLSSHPFVLYQACRGLILGRLAVDDDQLTKVIDVLLAQFVRSTRESVERLIAKHQLGTLSPSEAVALAFCGAILALAGSLEDQSYVITSIEICFRYQDENGCWPFGRVVREDKDIAADRLEIVTYEIAGVIGEALVALFEKSNEKFTGASMSGFIARLLKAGRYAERSSVRLNGACPRVGWCSDHAYGKEMIESWASATVLTSLVNLANLVHAHERESILADFATISPKDPDWPIWLRWRAYLTAGEVDQDHPILAYLNEKVVEPIKADPRCRPAASPRSVSTLLFGPPGTSKTTIVKAVAEGLGWPIVFLSPGTFIERGLEYIEAQARQVFDKLMRLSRAVVLFDECDELFRDRQPSSASEQTRGITAFVTASMLPKLQELHDRGRVVFFICTNNFAFIDPAVKRGGRIDHIVGVGPPDLVARRRILETAYSDYLGARMIIGVDFVDAAITHLAAYTERFTRTELQRAVRALLQTAPWRDLKTAESEAKRTADRLRPSIIIGTKEHDEFVATKSAVSHPVTEGV